MLPRRRFELTPTHNNEKFLRLAAFYEKAGLNKEEAGKLAYLNMLDSQTTLSDLEEKQYRALKEKIDKLTSKELSPPDP